MVVPFNYPEFTTRRVFVSEWIDGEKLSQSKADDVQDLVNVGVTACEIAGRCRKSSVQAGLIAFEVMGHYVNTKEQSGRQGGEGGGAGSTCVMTPVPPMSRYFGTQRRVHSST